jgi:DNA recombination protein RmuC
MTATDVVLVLLVLAAGLVAGFLLGRALARGDAAARVSATQARLEAEREAAAARLAAERAAADQRLDDLRAEQATLDSRLATVSQQALAENSEQLLRLAAERFSAQQASAQADLSGRQQAIESIVAPLREALTQVQQQMTQAEQARTQAYGALAQQVSSMRDSSDQLRSETRQLVTALRAPQVRGRWGEHQLRRVVEMAGMVEHCDFSEQVTLTGDEGQHSRPDLVVRLAGGRHVVVDAKVSFSGFLEAMEARDDATRESRLKAHARHLRTHVDQLGGKRYWEQLEPTPDFVVMFVPAEVFLNAALDEDPALLEHAFEKNVVIATPATFVALLRTVAYTWKQEALADNARQVYDLGKTLYARLATMGGHVTDMGKELTGAVQAYNRLVGSLESRVMVQARRFVDLQVADTAIEVSPHIDLAPRDVTVDELVASANDELLAIDRDRRRRASGSPPSG